MSTTTGVLIGTTIAPNNISIQQGAISTWSRLGFKVMSVNIPEEIGLLQAHFPEVSFVPANRSAETLTGKPFVYFDDILRALNASGSEFCGIINSDIYLRGDAGLSNFLVREAAESLVFATRIDITEPSDKCGVENTFGFDLFFFPRFLTTKYPPTELCLGMPWWDTWAVLAPILLGIPVKQLITPLGFHLAHVSRWSDLYAVFGARLFKHVSLLASSRGIKSPRSHDLEAFNTANYSIYALLVVSYAMAKASKLEYPGNMVGEQGTAHLAADRTATELLEISWQLYDCLAVLDEPRAALNEELRRARGSLSWRLTAPLRWLRSLISASGRDK